MDYIEAWKKVEKFFVDNGHTSLERYPVICRWFPGLYFNIASIVNFYRYSGNKLVFDFPTEPVIVPQPCLRFNDIPNSCAASFSRKARSSKARFAASAAANVMRIVPSCIFSVFRIVI